MRVLVTPDYRTLGQTAADLFIKALRTKPDLRVGLPTGSSPLGMYEELVRRYQSERLDFSQVRTFNLDEYLGLSSDHPMSYHCYMQQHLFAQINIAAENVHIPDGSPGVDAEAESKQYEEAILEASGIDLLIVGIAANGHIAFNEPGSAFDSRTRSVDLAAETLDNARQYFGDEPVPRRAITMGIGTILEARRILLLASGASKADAVERALHGPISPSVPASALQLHSNVVVVLDEAASLR
jgi:glucosamine-6-phosphate deaminase